MNHCHKCGSECVPTLSSPSLTILFLLTGKTEAISVRYALTPHSPQLTGQKVDFDSRKPIQSLDWQGKKMSFTICYWDIERSGQLSVGSHFVSWCKLDWRPPFRDSYDMPLKKKKKNSRRISSLKSRRSMKPMTEISRDKRLWCPEERSEHRWEGSALTYADFRGPVSSLWWGVNSCIALRLLGTPLYPSRECPLLA